MKRIRKVIVHIEKREEAQIDISPIITGARPVSVLSGPSGTFEHALAFAEANNTRLFTRAEAQYLFEHSEKFREAVKDAYFWVLESASVTSISRSFAWIFNSVSGGIYSNVRNGTFNVRCVGMEGK
jgi:hypothetical protein